ncbi:2362_t:CDS:2, partial [Ambispora gerdemannii]
GLGGTTYQGEESGRAYEGVDLSRDTVCRREQTLNRLLKCLLEKRIILVRSPPMTGKTTLSQLFEHNLLQSRSRVFRISLLWMERRNPSFTFEKGFEDLMKMTWPGFLDQCGQKETFLIVDEVQKIYKPENEDEPRHGGKVFWDPFKVIMQTTRLYIVAFASYGHYGAYTARGDHAVIDISSYHLPESNAWGFADVRFTEEEFCDYFDRFCEKNLKMLQKEDTPLFSRYVSAITAFHPGLVVFTMEQIHARFVKHTFESLTFSKIFAYLKSRDFNAHFEDLRAMPRITDMSDEEKKIVDTVLFKKRGLKIKTNAIPRERRIIKTNILVDTVITKNYSILDFPAPLLRATYLQNRFGSVTRSKTPPNTFRDFVTSVFAKMDPKVLQKSKGTGIDGRLLGRVWQMEFYRASMQVLPEDIHASVDVGAVFGSKGYIDFYIDDQHNWAIELLRDGDRLQEHEERFQERGIYVPILKYAKEWAVIDIRSNTKGFPEGHGKDVIYVVCAENFESVQLMYSDGTKVNVRLLGEEENLLGFDISEFLEDSMETD